MDFIDRPEEETKLLFFNLKDVASVTNSWLVDRDVYDTDGRRICNANESAIAKTFAIRPAEGEPLCTVLPLLYRLGYVIAEEVESADLGAVRSSVASFMENVLDVDGPDAADMLSVVPSIMLSLADYITPGEYVPDAIADAFSEMLRECQGEHDCILMDVLKMTELPPTLETVVRFYEICEKVRECQILQMSTE